MTGNPSRAQVRDPSALQEAALIDALGAAPAQLEVVLPLLRPETFGDAALGRIYEGMVHLDSVGRPIDRAHLLEWLGANSRPRDPDWQKELGQVLTGDVPAHDIEQRAQTVREHWRLRQVRDLCERYWKRSQTSTAMDAAGLIEELSTSLYELEAPGDGGHVEHNAGQVMDVVSADVAERMKRDEGDRMPGITTGYALLDDWIGGWVPQATTVLKALPGTGKSALALNLALRCAERQERTVLVFSLEMPELIVGQRLVGAAGGVPVTAIRRATFTYDEAMRFHGAVARIRQIASRLYVVDCHGLTPAAFRRICRRHARRAPGLGLVVLDYLQIMGSESQNPTRTDEVAAASQIICDTARSTDSHVVILSQVNTDGDSKSSKVPQENATNIIAIGPSEGESEDAERVMYDMKLPKNRHGPKCTGSAFQWMFTKKTQRFDTVDTRFEAGGQPEQQQSLEDWS